MRGRVNSAHVLALIAIVLAVGGNAFAFTLGKNTVGTKQLKRNAVTKIKIKKSSVNGPRVKNNSLTGADIKLSKLGTVPSANAANTANSAATANTANVASTATVADSLGPSEPWHEVGTPGEPPFLGSWANDEGFGETAAFYKDHEGIVHLKGQVTKGSSTEIFRLPPGYRPASGRVMNFVAGCTGGAGCEKLVSLIAIYGSGGASTEGGVFAPVGATFVDLDPISFRAGS